MFYDVQLLSNSEEVFNQSV